MSSKKIVKQKKDTKRIFKLSKVKSAKRIFKLNKVKSADLKSLSLTQDSSLSVVSRISAQSLEDLKSSLKLPKQVAKSKKDEPSKDVPKQVAKYKKDEPSKDVPKQVAKYRKDEPSKDVPKQLTKYKKDEPAKDAPKQVAKYKKEESTKDVFKQLTKYRIDESKDASKRPKRISNIPARQTADEIFKKITNLVSNYHVRSRPPKLRSKQQSKASLTISNKFVQSKSSIESLEQTDSILSVNKSIKPQLSSFFSSSSIKSLKIGKLQDDLDRQRNVKLAIKKPTKPNKYAFNKIAKKLKDPKYIGKNDLKSVKTCRICFSAKCNAKTGEMIMPCNCRGIFSTVHQRCVADWIVSMCSATCDICRFKFFIKSKHKNLIDFIIEEHQFVFIWRLVTIIFFSLYLVLIVSAFIAVVEEHHFINESYIFFYRSSCSLIIFMLLSYVGYYFAERYLTFRQWKKFQYHITVQPNPDSKFNEIVTPPFDPIRSSGLGEYSIKPIVRPVRSD